MKMQEMQKPTKNHWVWWERTNAIVHLKDAFNEINTISQENNVEESKAMNRSLANYLHITKGRKICFQSYSDIFYISRGKVETFLLLNDILYI